MIPPSRCSNCRAGGAERKSAPPANLRAGAAARDLLEGLSSGAGRHGASEADRGRLRFWHISQRRTIGMRWSQSQRLDPESTCTARSRWDRAASNKPPVGNVRGLAALVAPSTGLLPPSRRAGKNERDSPGFC
jgi:hypothetical protein